MILLDTHALIWLLEGQPSLGRKARRLCDEALRENLLAVSAISFWELAMLERKDRISLVQPLGVLRNQAVGLGLTELPVTGEIGIAAAAISNFQADPADRLITATATLSRATLLTADERILKWKGSLARHDARR